MTGFKTDKFSPRMLAGAFTPRPLASGILVPGAKLMSDALPAELGLLVPGAILRSDALSIELRLRTWSDTNECIIGET